MKRSERRILTTHVGSLVRPPELRALAQSGIDRPKEARLDAEYIRILERATEEVVKKQAAIGLDIISDGEFGKSSWSNYVLIADQRIRNSPDQLRPVEWLGRDLQRFGEVIAREMPTVLTGRPTEACVARSNIGIAAAIRRAIANFQRR